MEQDCTFSIPALRSAWEDVKISKDNDGRWGNTGLQLYDATLLRERLGLLLSGHMS